MRNQNKNQTPAPSGDPRFPHVVTLTDKEWAFILTCRRLVHANIQNLGIVKGEPTTFIGTLERIDLNKPEDLAKAMDGGISPLSSSD